jgi:hypothetical protein
MVWICRIALVSKISRQRKENEFLILGAVISNKRIHATANPALPFTRSEILLLSCK